MRFELHFDQYKSLILNFDFTNFAYFFIGLAVGISVFFTYKYLVSKK